MRFSFLNNASIYNVLCYARLPRGLFIGICALEVENLKQRKIYLLACLDFSNGIIGLKSV